MMNMSYIFLQARVCVRRFVMRIRPGKSRTTRLSIICIMTECNNEGRSVTKMFVSMNYVWVEFFKIPLVVLKTCTWHFDWPFNYLNFDERIYNNIYVYNIMMYLSIGWALNYRIWVKVSESDEEVLQAIQYNSDIVQWFFYSRNCPTTILASVHMNGSF